MEGFQDLVQSIQQAHTQLQAAAANAVNQSLTIRNWLIGCYIVEFEQHGRDRAVYGENLMGSLVEALSGIKGIDRRGLFRFRQFYLAYKGFGEVLLSEYPNLLKVGTPSPLLKQWQPSSKQSPAQAAEKLQLPAKTLISRLSFSHFELLLNCDDPLKRTFYELECVKGTWSVRELKRQMQSLYFERCGLSERPEALFTAVQQRVSPQVPRDIIKNIYAFEFIGLTAREAMEESDLETALLDHLEAFLIELGNGFCFEARQKRILIGENYYYIDLLFYHRVLKCHVLIELKLGAFSHGDIGQLNTYLHYFKRELCEADDNPPVGILLVAEKDHALAQYATAGMDPNLFIQEYLIRLPTKDQLEQYVAGELRRMAA